MEQEYFDITQFGLLLIDIGASLQSAGASSSRIRITMERFAQARQLKSHFVIGPKSIAVTLISANGVTEFTGLHSSAAAGVNFKLLSGLSRLSWRFVEEPMTIQQVRDELSRLTSLPHYPRWLSLIMVSLAGAAFCFTFGGDAKQMCITFIATFFGLFVNQELKKNKFNPYLCTYVSATTAALVTALFFAAGLNLRLAHAYSTCVLFLIPGVPLINAFSDLIDGEILHGLERGTNALLHTLAIAAGLSTILMIFNIQA